MPPIRFRIRTIMIVIATVAVLMAVAVEFRIIPLMHAFLEIVPLSQLIPVAVFAAVLFASVVEFLVFWDRYWSHRRRAGRFSRKGIRPIGRPLPDQGGESKRV
jgi:hypothetical protein